MIRDYRIHGDNIVECERALELISRALRIPYDNEWLPVGSPLTPTYSLTPTNSIDTFRFTFFPGYGRWDVDILNVVRSRGGRLREAPDAIVCRFDDGREVPLFAIEFSGALPAGNQAWQRSGRALSFAHASIPYIYIAELSGFELNSDRDRKAERLPNPAVPFSYLLLAEEVKSPTVPIFVRSPGASEKAVDAHSSFYGDEELVETIRLSILGLPTDVPVKELNSRALGLVSYLARNRKGKKNTLSPEQWGEAYQANVRGDTLPSYLVREAPIAWSPRALPDRPARG